MRRIGRSLLVMSAVLLGSIVATPAPAPAQSASTTTTTTTTIPVDNGDANRVIPLPNSGRKPTQFGDRGAPGQQITFGLLVLGLAVVGFVVVRSTRRNSKLRDAQLRNDG